MPRDLTDREFQQLIFEKLDSIDNRQAATARAVRNLADGLSAERAQHQIDGQRWDTIQGAAIAALNDPDIAAITPHDLANAVPQKTLDKARAIVHARNNGEPEPLPDTPEDLVPVHHHRRRDDSVAFNVDKTGATRLKADIRLKTIAGWGLAIVLGVLHVWRLVHDALH